MAEDCELILRVLRSERDFCERSLDALDPPLNMQMRAAQEHYRPLLFRLNAEIARRCHYVPPQLDGMALSLFQAMRGSEEVRQTCQQFAAVSIGTLDSIEDNLEGITGTREWSDEELAKFCVDALMECGETIEEFLERARNEI